MATGPRSEIGKIGQSLGNLETTAPHLQTQTRKLVSIFALVGAAVSLLVVVLYGTLRGGWLDAILAGIAVGMSMLPEEFPVVLAVFMAMGAWRISQARVLTRRASAIEALGSATVLCTDKTGTLTENRMTIAELRLADGSARSVTGSEDDAACFVPGPHPYRRARECGRAIRPDGEGFSCLGQEQRRSLAKPGESSRIAGQSLCVTAGLPRHVACLARAF